MSIPVNGMWSLTIHRVGEIGEDSGEVLEEHITMHSEFDKEDDHTLMTTNPKVSIENLSVRLHFD